MCDVSGMKECQFIAFCITALIIAVMYVPACFAVEVSEASIAIRQAEQDLNDTFVKVFEVDSVGGDISLLLNKLNKGVVKLSEANAAFKTGDYLNAVVMAKDCSDFVNGVENEAANLLSYAKEKQSNMILSTVFVSFFGVLFVIIIGFMGWRFLRKRYFKGVLNKHPKVADVL